MKASQHTSLTATSSPLCTLTPETNQTKPTWFTTQNTKPKSETSKQANNANFKPHELHTQIEFSKRSTTDLSPKLKLPTNHMIHDPIPNEN